MARIFVAWAIALALFLVWWARLRTPERRVEDRRVYQAVVRYAKSKPPWRRFMDDLANDPDPIEGDWRVSGIVGSNSAPAPSRIAELADSPHPNDQAIYREVMP